MRLVRVSEPRMGSCLAAGGSLTPSSAISATTTATTTITSFGFDHLEMEMFKPSTTSPCSSLTSSSSPSSTISEASNTVSPHLYLSTRKPRTPRKRPNQTHDEAAALLSSAYPSIFSIKKLAKPHMKFSKRTEPKWVNANSSPPSSSTVAVGEELLLPLSIIPAKIGNCGSSSFEPKLALGNKSSSSSSSNNNSNSSNEKGCRGNPVAAVAEEEEEEEFQFYRGIEEDDFDAESILDEEIGEGIESIMGNPGAAASSSYENGNYNYSEQQAASSKICYGIPMGLGLLGSRLNFGMGMGMWTGMARGVRALRSGPEWGLEGGDWWRCPVTTVEVGAISPRLEEEDMKAPSASASNGSCLSVKNESNKKKKKKKKMKVSERMLAVAGEEGVLKGGEYPSRSEKMMINLKLNYDEILSAWSEKGSMFSDEAAGPEMASTDVSARLAQINLFGEGEGVGGGVGVGGRREAIVQRYKEKRMARLFSKKIRYQVRKVNADQRPRMKAVAIC